MKFKTVNAFILVLMVCFTPTTDAQSVQFDKAAVKINSNLFTVEFAHTFEQRAQGLMFRKSLCDECGMAFLFEPEKQASMWMKNTSIPLDVAFIDKFGLITDIKPLTPHDLTSVGASKMVKYALEMNQGWFAKNDIKVGDQVVIIPLKTD